MTNFDELSPNEEKVLEELKHIRLDNGLVDFDKIKEKYDGFNTGEIVIYNSILIELQKKDVIRIAGWYDNLPEIMLNNKGVEYFSEKERYRKKRIREDRRIIKKDLIIAVAGAIIGAVISNITDIINWINTMIGK